MSLETDIDRLARVPLFSGMDHEALRLMAFAAEKRILRAGDILFRQGDDADGGVLVISGLIAMDGPGEASPNPRMIGPGALIGEHALLVAARRPRTATAREASCVLAISRNLFTRVLLEYPANARAVRRFWAQRLCDKLSNLKNVDRP